MSQRCGQIDGRKQAQPEQEEGGHVAALVEPHPSAQAEWAAPSAQHECLPAEQRRHSQRQVEHETARRCGHQNVEAVAVSVCAIGRNTPCAAQTLPATTSAHASSRAHRSTSTDAGIGGPDW